MEQISEYRESILVSFILRYCKRRARMKGREFNLSSDWVLERLRAGVCEVTGLPFDVTNISRTDDQMTSPWRPSVDRIDSSKGYTEDNCQLVVLAYNRMKSDMTEEQMRTLAIAIAKPLLKKAIEAKRLRLAA
jgi:hypothetical protein